MQFIKEYIEARGGTGELANEEKRTLAEMLGGIGPQNARELRAKLKLHLDKPAMDAVFRLNNIVGDWDSIFHMLESRDTEKGELSSYIDAIQRDCAIMVKELAKFKSSAKKKGI